MEIFVMTISILAIAGAVWAANKILYFHICPICAGVAGTWLWMLAGIYLGLLPTSNFPAFAKASAGWQLLISISMGGSVVGIAYQLAPLEISRPKAADAALNEDGFLTGLKKTFTANRSPLLFKSLFVPAGFAAVYGLLSGLWGLFATAIVLVAIIPYVFLKPPKNSREKNKNIEKLENKMKECC